MSIILYINGQQVDTDKNTQISQTKQVNDLNRLDNRQANYTNTFKVPRTANNIRIFQFLSYPGNNSNVPYQKNECTLYSNTGECFVYKGWAVVTNTDNDYNINVYDGIVDMYRAIENKNLSELGLDGITHSKDVATVVASWHNDLNFRYILADYNGNTGDTAAGEVNIDYLVPSVKVSYLWNKIFEMYGSGGLGVGYDGSIFYNQYFKNLYMTYPKGFASTGDNDVDVFESNSWGFPVSDNSKYFARFDTAILNDLAGTVGNIHLKVNQSAVYRLEVSGQLYGRVNPIPRDAWLRVLKNCEGLTTSQISDYTYNLYNTSGSTVLPVESKNIPHGSEFSYVSTPFYLSENESICLFAQLAQDAPNTQAFVLYPQDNNHLEVKLVRIDATEVDFGVALADFSIKDFLNEVVHRFGLTMFKDKYSNVYKFLTLQEVLQTNYVVDWSSKFIKRTNEKYVNGTYAQRNWFRYNYNDKEETHKDGHIDITNPNLPDSIDVIKSKIYAPEKANSIYLGELTNVYKLWDKEIKEDNSIQYKQLDKRYYFLRAMASTGSITVHSDELAQDIEVTSFYKESFYRLSFQDIINDYYRPIGQILNNSQIVDVELNLKETDIVNFDFKKLYYIEQLSSYFIMNKINNYVPDKPVKCEMVRVLFSPMPQPGNSNITITNVQKNNTPGSEYIILTWVADYQAGQFRVQYSETGIDNWIDIAADVVSPKQVSVNELAAGLYFFRIIDVTYQIYSDAQQIIVI